MCGRRKAAYTRGAHSNATQRRTPIFDDNREEKSESERSPSVAKRRQNKSENVNTGVQCQQDIFKRQLKKANLACVFFEQGPFHFEKKKSWHISKERDTDRVERIIKREVERAKGKEEREPDRQKSRENREEGNCFEL